MEESAARSPAVLAIPVRRVPVRRLKARVVAAALKRAQVQAALATATQKEIAKKNTELFTAAWAHPVRFA